MKLDQVAGSHNDEFYTPEYAISPLKKYIPPGSTVWCPFDTSESLIVKEFSRHGCFVLFSHLSLGQDFFSYFPTGLEVDYIISNPPYSMKTEVFERLFSLGIPFAMLVGVVGLFESERRFSMFEKNEFEILWMNKRVAYFKDYKDKNPSLNPPFSSVWITRKVLPKGNIFARIEKKR